MPHQGLGLRATERPLRSHPKATYVPSWTWQALRVTSQPDLRTAASSMNFNSPFPNSLPPQAPNSPVQSPTSKNSFYESSKTVLFGPFTIYGLGEKRWEGKHLEYLLCSLSKGTLFAEEVILCPHTLFSLGLKQEFDEVSLDPFQYHRVMLF